MPHRVCKPLHLLFWIYFQQLLPCLVLLLDCELFGNRTGDFLSASSGWDTGFATITDTWSCWLNWTGLPFLSILCICWAIRKSNQSHLMEGPALPPVSQWVPELSLLRTSCRMLCSLLPAGVLWGHGSVPLPCTAFTLATAFSQLNNERPPLPGPAPLILLSSAPPCSARVGACRTSGWTTPCKDTQHGNDQDSSFCHTCPE